MGASPVQHTENHWLANRCSHVSPTLTRVLCMAYCSDCCCLIILTTFWTRGPHFHFALGSMNNAASSEGNQGAGDAKKSIYRERMIVAPPQELKLWLRRNWRVGWHCKVKDKHKMTVISHHLGHGVKISAEKVVRGCGFDHCGVHFYVVLLNCVSLGPRLQTKETKKGLRKVHRAIKENG